MDRACMGPGNRIHLRPARQVDPQRRAAVAKSLKARLASLGNVGVPDNRRAALGRPSTNADDVG